MHPKPTPNQPKKDKTTLSRPLLTKQKIVKSETNPKQTLNTHQMNTKPIPNKTLDQPQTNVKPTLTRP